MSSREAPSSSQRCGTDSSGPLREEAAAAPNLPSAHRQADATDLADAPDLSSATRTQQFQTLCREWQHNAKKEWKARRAKLRAEIIELREELQENKEKGIEEAKEADTEATKKYNRCEERWKNTARGLLAELTTAETERNEARSAINFEKQKVEDATLRACLAEQQLEHLQADLHKLQRDRELEQQGSPSREGYYIISGNHRLATAGAQHQTTATLDETSLPAGL
jgi:hypothetical protein